MQKRYFPIVVVLLFAFVLSACGGVAAAQGVTPTAPAEQAADNTRTISVRGSGTAYLTPDMATINIGVHTEDADAAKAVATNNANSQDVIDALRSFGIPAKDIRTTNFSIFPQQQYDREGNPGEIKYVVDNTVLVTVRDLDQIGELLDAAVQAGANSIYGIQFDVADKSQALSSARQAAVAQAEATAEELASAAGVEVGQVLSISTTESPSPKPYYEARGMGAADVAAAAPISSGEMSIVVEVNVIYGIQ